jgi:molybdopterin molybdotransferase
MVPFEQARSLVLQAAPLLGCEVVPLRQAAGRVLREDVAAPRDVPSFDNSALDGYALRAADVAGASPESPAWLEPVGLAVAGGQAAGAVGPGQAVRIMTGARIPPGADAVVGVEDVRLEAGRVAILKRLAPGDNLRRAGEDLRAGAQALEAGRRLSPVALGVLASLGRAEACVGRRPRVAVLATGDEILPVGAPWREGATYSSNTVTLCALAEQAGAEALDRGVVPDDPAEMERRLGAALVAADVVLTTGGVSMGDRDHVRGVAARLGVKELLWQVAMKPGKPTYAGALGQRLLIGIPGNPAAAPVVFLSFVAPALLRMQGATVVEPLDLPATLEAPVRTVRGRMGLMKGLLSFPGGQARVTPLEGQGSGILSTLARANCLILAPGDGSTLPIGATVTVRLL